MKLYKCTKCGKKKQQHEFRTRNSNSNGIERVCKVCISVASKAYYEKNKERIKKNTSKYAKANSEKVAATQAAYVRANKDKIKAKRIKRYQENREAYAKRARDYYQRNAEKVKARRNEYHAKHPETNAKRRATQKNALPAWLTKQDRADIRSVYKSCRNITKKTGIPHHVDHIIPLQNDLVCGLHVPWNLQVLPATDNMKKHNSFDEDMVYSTLEIGRKST